MVQRPDTSEFSETEILACFRGREDQVAAEVTMLAGVNKWNNHSSTLVLIVGTSL